MRQKQDRSNLAKMTSLDSCRYLLSCHVKPCKNSSFDRQTDRHIDWQ